LYSADPRNNSAKKYLNHTIDSRNLYQNQSIAENLIKNRKDIITIASRRDSYVPSSRLIQEFGD
jgi:hypothetical protein